ncbi:MAG TPA: hypothetical protein VH643_40980 [Gemmataceae bacterium]|jgi:hypothetical protein
MRIAYLAFAAVFGLTACGAATGAEKKIELSVLYVGNASTPRGKDYTELLRRHFRRVAVEVRKGFDPRQAATVDVVVLDWSQSDRPQSNRPGKPVSPLGPLAAWEKPTVLLGSAGLLLAQAWEINGAIG